VSGLPVSGLPVAAAPPKRRARTRWLIGGVIGGVAVVILAVAALLVAAIVIPVSMLTNSPEWLAESAIQDLAEVPALSYRGSFVDDHGRATELEAQVATGDGATATVSVDGRRAEVAIDQTGTYVRAGAEYWNSEHPGGAGIYAGRWVNAGSGALGLNIGLFLKPKALAQTLERELLGTDAGQLRKGPVTIVNGARAVRISAREGGGLYVTVDSPHRVVHVDGPLLIGGRPDDPHNYAFDVNALAGPELDGLTMRLAGLPTLVRGAVDRAEPESLPAFYRIDEMVDVKDAECTDVSCRFVAVVRNVYGPSRPGGQATLLGIVTAGKKPGGVLIGRCDATLPAMARDKPARVSCVVHDRLWASWNRKQTSSWWYQWQLAIFNPGWAGRDVALFRGLLEGNVDMTLVDEVSGHGPIALATFARLLRYPGVTAAAAAGIVKTAAELKQLDVVHGYVMSGRLGNPAGLQGFLERASAELTRVPAKFDRVRQLRAAAERAKAGSGPVALEAWTPAGAKAPVGTADVLDAGRKEAVQYRAMAATDTVAVVAQIGTAADQLRGWSPAGYRRLVEIQIASMRSPLYPLNREELRGALKKHGLSAATLREIGALVVVNKSGRHSYAPTDFR
jgi:hypothetical protein